MLKKMLCGILCAVMLIVAIPAPTIYASDLEENIKDELNNEAELGNATVGGVSVNAESAVLMDATTGTVLFAKSANTPLPPASVTKIMTLLLVAEALESGAITLDKKVRVSESAASMGGSQIFLKEGEEFTVEELLKSTVIASANDAAVALAELIAGSEAGFVGMMNRRAKELNMKNTVFENATGLDDTVENHLTGAYDIALMSRELMKHDAVMKYSGVWQDSIRNGEFILTNTNRLVRYYSGCTGLKTGSTDKAGFCISATAERDGMELIAVIMGAPTRDERNTAARTLLDYGFANYAVFSDPETTLERVPVKRGCCADVEVYSTSFSALIGREDLRRVEKTYSIPDNIIAPFDKGAKIGEVIYRIGDRELGRADICTADGCRALNLIDVFLLMLSAHFVK